MPKRSFLASLAIVLTLILAPAAGKADDPGGGGSPIYQVPPDGLGGAGGGLGSNCILTFAQCLNTASNLPTWWERSAAGLDCYVDMAICIYRATQR